MRVSVAVLVLPLAAGACWKDDYAEIPPDVLRFEPPVDAPDGWLVAPFDVNLECPDDTTTRFYLLYPEEAAASGTPLPMAVLYHSGSFDFVFAPDPADPLTGTHFASPSRLTSEFAVRQVFTTLGMYPAQIETELHEGLLPTVLAENGVAVMLPANCWGDLWGNKSGGADNDFPSDFYFRQGRAAAEWAYKFAVDETFRLAFGVELPVVADPSQVYVVGLGEGGRAVAELLSIDNDADGVPDYPVAGALVDSSPDDLRVVFDDPGLYASTVEGLLRMFPGGVDRTTSGSLWAAPLPARIGYVHSVQDTAWPDAVHLAAAARIEAAGGWVHASPQPGSVLLNGGGDIGLARGAVGYLLTGQPPPL